MVGSRDGGSKGNEGLENMVIRMVRSQDVSGVDSVKDSGGLGMWTISTNFGF